MQRIGTKSWLLATVNVRRSAEETATVLLIDLGSLGIVTFDETDEAILLGAYFPDDLDAAELSAEIERAFSSAGCRDDLLSVTVAIIPDQDWLQKWKEGFEPGVVGDRLAVVPSWKFPPPATDRLILRIDPGMAFGTGTHETTRLCLELIEKYWHGRRLLDVGTGTGILAIAAELLRPGSQVVAVDVDPQAIQVARDNVKTNAVGTIETVVGQPRDLAGQSFDLVVANLTAEVIADLAPDLAGCVGRGALLIASGILTELTSGVENALERTGFEIIERRHAGEWVAIVARRL